MVKIINSNIVRLADYFFYTSFKDEKQTINKIVELSDSIEVKLHDLKIGKRYVIDVTKNETSINFILYIDESKILEAVEVTNYSQVLRVKELLKVVETLFLLDDSNSEIKKKLHKIRCDNGKCPICESQMIMDTSVYKCINGCYAFNKASFSIMDINCIILNEKFNYPLDQDSLDLQKKVDIIDKACEKIEEWKKDDKYLIEILKG